MMMRKLPIIAAASIGLATPAFGAGNVLFTESFDNNAFGSRGWYDNTGLPVTTSESFDGKGGSVYFRFRNGATVPDNTSSGMRHTFTATEQVYISYWVRYSDNWEGSNVSYHPHEFYLLTNKDSSWSGLAETYLTLYIEQNEGEMLFALQDTKNINTSYLKQDIVDKTEDRAVAGCNGDPDGFKGGCYLAGSTWRNEKKIRSGSTSFQNGKWHKVEAFIKLNSITNGVSQNDGIARYWVDGELVMDHENLVMRTALHPDMKFNQFIIGPYIGVGSPVDQTFWVDELVIATDRTVDVVPPPNPPVLISVE